MVEHLHPGLSYELRPQWDNLEYEFEPPFSDIEILDSEDFVRRDTRQFVVKKSVSTMESDL